MDRIYTCDKCQREAPYDIMTLMIGRYMRKEWHCRECYRDYQLKYLLEGYESE
jgi:hypothetical protein